MALDTQPAHQLCLTRWGSRTFYRLDSLSVHQMPSDCTNDIGPWVWYSAIPAGVKMAWWDHWVLDFVLFQKKNSWRNFRVYKIPSYSVLFCLTTITSNDVWQEDRCYSNYGRLKGVAFAPGEPTMAFGRPGKGDVVFSFEFHVNYVTCDSQTVSATLFSIVPNLGILKRIMQKSVTMMDGCHFTKGALPERERTGTVKCFTMRMEHPEKYKHHRVLNWHMP